MNPLLAFGIITDIQYADVDDGHNYSKTKRRYYRNAVKLATNAVRSWQNNSATVEFILQLGDIIDGHCKKQPERALNTVLEVFTGYRDNIIHVIGNHELYNFKRTNVLKQELFSPNFLKKCSVVKDRLYYSHTPHKRLKIVVLDCYEIGVLGYDGDEPEYRQAKHLLDTMNPNVDKHDSTGMHGTDQRFVRYNGGVGDQQLKWLNEQLSESTNSSENVIVVGHTPLHVDSSANTNLCWNYKDVMGVLKQHDCVIAYLAGHEHNGGSAVDEQGVPFIVFPAVLESLDEDVFATAYMYSDRIEIIGHGIVDNFTLNLKFPITDASSSET